MPATAPKPFTALAAGPRIDQYRSEPGDRVQVDYFGTVVTGRLVEMRPHSIDPRDFVVTVELDEPTVIKGFGDRARKTVGGQVGPDGIARDSSGTPCIAVTAL